MNRIRELREARGFSATQLAELVGTSQPQITRLERGERKLTADWMSRLAKALKCTPTDLIAAATLAEFAEEAEPYTPEETRDFSSAFAARNLAFFRLTSDSLEKLGLHPGRVIMIDISQSAVENVKTGDVVVAQVYSTDELLSARTIVRQFIAPAMLTTNRDGTNVAFQMASSDFEAHIKGVMVPDETSRGS